MSWEPVTQGELLMEMGVALDEADDEVRAAWERMRIEPEKWRLSPEGDAGGGFWVVGIAGDVAIWFNDIEGGFNRSRFTVRGTLSEYACNQGDFGEFLRTLPEAERNEQYAESAPSREIPAALRGAGTIERRQTTYWALQASSGALARAHFSGKHEHRFAGAQYESVQLFESHPVLLDYQEPWSSVFVSHGGGAGQTLVDELTAYVETATSGWRQLRHYLAAGGPTLEVLASGSGKLLAAPHSIALGACEVVQKHGARATALDERPARRDACALVLGSSYVIARAFRLQA
jgi:hypothetical protein